MKPIKRVFIFVTICFLVYLAGSVIAQITGYDIPPFNRVNLISDIVGSSDSAAIAEGKKGNTSSGETVPATAGRKFEMYMKAGAINNFSADTQSVALIGFSQKLADLKAGKRKKVRIAFLGDSMIEGDLMSQTLRQLLQAAFGGSGVGFVPITSPVAGFRQTATATFSKNWTDDNFKNNQSGKLYLSGHSFSNSDGWVQIRDNTITTPGTNIEKSLLCGYTAAPVTVNYNSAPFTVNANQPVNRIVLGNDAGTSAKLGVTNKELPVYGISFESETGIFVDNFSFRGISGVEYGKIAPDFMQQIQEANPYDLIIFQYGVNVLFQPNNKNFDWYAKSLLPVVEKFRKVFTDADFLMVSTADRAFRYNGVYQSAVGIDSLIKTQAEIAFQTQSGFYNQFETMGGKNSIVDWANRKPSLANKDYVHPNHNGAPVLAEYLYKALIKDYEKLNIEKKPLP